MSGVLHYIYDPLCGWCYGAEPLVWAGHGVKDLELRLHGGGLWPEPTRLPDSTRRYIQQADARIAAMSGQPFGAPYLSGLLLDPSMVLDSRPTIAAVLAAESLDPRNALTMLKGIQHAHYEQGRRVVEREVLCDIAAECGFARQAFAEALDDAPVDAHIAETRRLMGRVGAAGFPAFVLQTGDAVFAVPHQRFAASPAELAKWLRDELQTRSPSPASV
jgi:putative protein-disulfide isomerase